VRDRFAADKADVIGIYPSVSKDDARITAYSKAINVLNSVQLALTFISKHLLHDQWWEAKGCGKTTSKLERGAERLGVAYL
jgi:hypothetical protein